jgi:hypothetical protein
MPNGFGFSRPGQQPSPDPRQVGAQLSQRGQQGQQGQQVQPQYDDRRHAEFPAQSREEALRREGGKLMGGGGDDNDGAMSAAVGEALTRAGGGHRGNPNPYKDRARHFAQLQQLGLSELEAQLLGDVV